MWVALVLESDGSADLGEITASGPTPPPDESRRVREVHLPGCLCVLGDHMPEPSQHMEVIARQIQIALDSSDLTAFNELLDPDVTWGAPHAKNPACKSRDQVLA